MLLPFLFKVVLKLLKKRLEAAEQAEAEQHVADEDANQMCTFQFVPARFVRKVAAELFPDGPRESRLGKKLIISCTPAAAADEPAKSPGVRGLVKVHGSVVGVGSKIDWWEKKLTKLPSRGKSFLRRSGDEDQPGTPGWLPRTPLGKSSPAPDKRRRRKHAKAIEVRGVELLNSLHKIVSEDGVEKAREVASHDLVYASLMAHGVLEAVPIHFADAIQGQYRQRFLAVSHRWLTGDAPDAPEGAECDQLAAIAQYLDRHPEVEWVWYDYWCMPQNPTADFEAVSWVDKIDRYLFQPPLKRTGADKVFFGHMLGNSNILYLCLSVLVLLDRSSLSRFWTQFEAWLAFRRVSSKGLDRCAPSNGVMNMAEKATGIDINGDGSVGGDRCEITTMYGAPASLRDSLVSEWKHVTLEEAHEKLSAPDVVVTNQGDKVQQLKKVFALDEMVRNVSKLAPSETLTPGLRGLHEVSMDSTLGSSSMAEASPAKASLLDA